MDDPGKSRVLEAALKMRGGALRSARLVAIMACPLPERPSSRVPSWAGVEAEAGW